MPNGRRIASGAGRVHRSADRGADSELRCKHGVSEASIYKWKAKFRGMDVSEAKRLMKTLED
ncbi:hypothetical protein LCM4579_28225 [Ensifer sp. LCM 4579]|nr:hypothetical protein LCM4579_28225 [Ensifer sp. LCM 4579]